MGLLDGKKGLVLNIANDRSIAAHIAHSAVQHGATVGVGFLPMDNAEKSERRVRKAMEEYGFPEAWLHPCDVANDQQIDRFFASAKGSKLTAPQSTVTTSRASARAKARIASTFGP